MSTLGDFMPTGLIEWGPVIGAGVQSGVAIMTRMFAPASSWFARNSEATGLLASAVAAAGLSVSPRTRGAAVHTLFGALAAGLPRVIETYAVKSGAVAGMGYYAAETAHPMLGMVRADQIAGAGMGYAMAQPQPHAYGTVPGVAGIAGPMADNGQAPIALLGVGGTHQTHMSLARHYMGA